MIVLLSLIVAPVLLSAGGVDPKVAVGVGLLAFAVVTPIARLSSAVERVARIILA
jgi:hypothetical protein